MNPIYYVWVQENVDFRQYISFELDKIKSGNIVKPKSGKYEKVKPILRDLFINHYSLALKLISEETIQESEFYLLKNSNYWYEVAYYPLNKLSGKSIEIDFRDGVDFLSLSIDCSKSQKYKPKFKKKAIAITKEKFQQFLNCTIQFLYDSDSYLIFIDDYLKKFYQLVESDTRIEGFIISAEKSFENIFKQLNQRKENIEKRLIESDTDSNLDRAKLRGELEGIQYAITTIKSNS